MFYILLFQIISFPITEGAHFIITFCPIIYYFYSNCKKQHVSFIFTVMLIFYVLGFNMGLYNWKIDTIYEEKGSFMNYKRAPIYLESYFSEIKSYKEKQPNARGII